MTQPLFTKLDLNQSNTILRESDQNPLDSLTNFINQVRITSQDFKKHVASNQNNTSSINTFLDEKNEEFFINDINIFEKEEDSLNNGKYNVFQAYQRNHKECKVRSNHRLREEEPYVSEFTLTIDQQAEKGLLETNNFNDFSENFNNLLNQQFLEKSGFLALSNENKEFYENVQKVEKYDENHGIMKNDKYIEKEMNNSFKWSLSSSLSFEFSKGINSFLKPFNQSFTNSSLLSIGSDKENTPPLLKDQIKAHRIDNNDEDNMNFLLKYDIGFNGISCDDIDISNDMEIPLTLTLQDINMKKQEFSLDLVIILAINEDSLKKDFFNRKAFVNLFEYIFTCMRENDRLAIIRSNKKSGFIQRLSSISKSMKKLMIQFLNYEAFSNENNDLYQGLELALNELNQRTYKNNFTCVLIIANEGFDKDIKDNKDFNEKSRNLVNEYRFNIDSCFHISSLYFGDNLFEMMFFENICFNNKGLFYQANKLAKLKKILIILMKELKSISLFNIEIFIKFNNKNIIKSMQSANCNIEKTKLDGSFNITLPSLKFQEKKKLLISIKLQNFKNIKQKSINLLKIQIIANKYTQSTSLFNQTLNFDKLITNPLDVSIYMNLPYDKIRLNNTVYLYIYQVKLGDVLISLIDNLIKSKENCNLSGIVENFEKNEENLKIKRILLENQNGGNCQTKILNYMRFLQDILQKCYHFCKKEDYKKIHFIFMMIRNLKFGENSLYYDKGNLLKELRDEMKIIRKLFEN